MLAHLNKTLATVRRSTDHREKLVAVSDRTGLRRDVAFMRAAGISFTDERALSKKLYAGKPAEDGLWLQVACSIRALGSIRHSVRLHHRPHLHLSTPIP